MKQFRFKGFPKLPPVEELKKKRNNFLLKLFIAVVFVYFYFTQMGLNFLQAQNEIYAGDRVMLENVIAKPPDQEQLVNQTEETYISNTIKPEAAARIDQRIGGELAGYGAIIVKHSKNYKIDPYLVYSIIRHETANGTSKAVINLKNPGGLMNPSTDKLMNFPNLETGIQKMCEILKRYYYDEGRTTVESIGRKYCPVGVANDPTNLNQHWIPAVSKYYLEVKK